ncbi:MAG: right-handed parallel beta-helix repeat-containing protein [Kofleriaceae bacterium]|nr:right-handed parallel beta-helix repeat-containing protein [Kofleriaceae bacterium]MCB9573606.1 right-handed parallel beta-helix repeat-containing protein [Kofleriaceae bacterium]
MSLRLPRVPSRLSRRLSARLVRPIAVAGVSLAGLTLAACGGDDVDPCAGVTGTCVPITAGASQTEIQTALIDVQPGSTIAFAAGTFSFTSDLSLDVDGVTIQGAGMDDTILSFAGQTSGGQGILVTADDFTIQDIGLEDSPGDLLKIEGADGVTIRRVRAEWTGGPMSSNGSYGLYPVQCSNVLIEGSKAIGASDAGIYVGQSDNIIIRDSVAESNVAGIEIENSTDADVHDNEAYHNTGGILVFNLPGLQVHNGARTRVFDNHSYDNDTENFAPAGNIVGKVPTGTGIAILAAHEVEIFGNTIENHASVNLGIISYSTTGLDFSDALYDPDPDTLYIHDNTFTGTSANPTGELGALLILAMSELQSPFMAVPDIAWDGVVPADKADPADPTKLMDALQICIQNNGDADFANLHWPNTEDPIASTDASDHDCTHDPLPEVVLE